VYAFVLQGMLVSLLGAQLTALGNDLSEVTALCHQDGPAAPKDPHKTTTAAAIVRSASSAASTTFLRQPNNHSG